MIALVILNLNLRDIYKEKRGNNLFKINKKKKKFIGYSVILDLKH